MRGAGDDRGARRWAAIGGVVAAAAVVGVAAWFLLTRDGGLLGARAPEFSFDVIEVSAAGVTGRAHRATLEPAVEAIRATVDDLYVGGFVDRERWDEGEFPGLSDAFAGAAATRARQDVGDLTLGEAARRVSFVEPTQGRLEVRFLLGEEGNPFAAWATTLFRARGAVDDGGIAIEHRGRYLLRPVEDRWLIVGYEVAGRVRPGAAPVEETP